MFRILSAAAKNIGPEISYTSVCAGTSLSVMLSGSSSSSTYFQPSTSMTSLMRFMKRIAASRIPTSIAATRSNTTVRTKVVTSTMISLFGDDLQRLTKVLQPHML